MVCKGQGLHVVNRPYTCLFCLRLFDEHRQTPLKRDNENILTAYIQDTQSRLKIHIFTSFFNTDASDTTVKLQVTVAPKSLLPMVWQKQVEVVHNSHCKVQIRRRLLSPIPLSSVLGLLVGCLRLLGTQQIGSLMPAYHKLQACTCLKNHTIFSNLPASVPWPNQ